LTYPAGQVLHVTALTLGGIWDKKLFHAVELLVATIIVFEFELVTVRQVPYSSMSTEVLELI
jgi:hypothetical protein